jgi:hypothetical protein
LDTAALSSDTEELGTVPLPTPGENPAGGDRKRVRGRRWRGLTGSFAAGLVVLAVVVLGSGVLALSTGAPGPGLLMLIGHPIGAILALVAQRVADRKTGGVAVGAGAAVLAITAATVWSLWLA